MSAPPPQDQQVSVVDLPHSRALSDPSMAMVAYVAVLDGVGQSLLAETCPATNGFVRRWAPCWVLLKSNPF